MAALAGLAYVVPDGWVRIAPGAGVLVTPAYVGRPAIVTADQVSAPLGESPRVTTTSYGAGDCERIGFDGHGRLITTCGDTLRLVDPDSLRQLATKDLAAAQNLLVGDLHNVLLDLGSPGVKGSGLLGAMAASSSTAGTANFQLAQATRKATSYGNVRDHDVAALLLRQAQTDKALTLQAELPAFELHLPASAEHHTVFTFHLGDGS